MLDQKTQEQEETDLWNEANNPPEKTYDLFGKVELKIFKGAYQKGTRGAVPFNPAVHDKATTIVKIYIQPLAEMDVKYLWMLEDETAVWAEWAKITFPSIKALGINDGREINDRWARIARVPNGRKYDKIDKATGQATGEQGDKTTFKFVEFFADESACRAAYLAAGGASGSNGASGHNVPAQVGTEDAERATAYQFLKVIVGNAVRGVDNWQTAKETVTQALAQYPTVAKFFTVDSVETGQLMTEANDKLLPF